MHLETLSPSALKLAQMVGSDVLEAIEDHDLS
jgi:hypothetical protein